MSAKDACKITWGDIIFDSEDYQYVRVYLYKKDLAGATHDYTHPIFPIEAELLHKRYDVLVKKYSTDKIANMFVATATNSEKKQLLPKDLTAFCRAELLQSGIGYAAIAKAKENESGGGGIRLLINNYEQKLTYECGLINDSASVKFLMGRSLLGDVTANNYRSFSCPEGQERLYRIMRRDGRFSTKKDIAEPIKRENTPTGGETITVDSPDPQRLSGAKLVMRLKKGDTISVMSTCGVQGVISARSIKSDGTTRRK